MAWPASVTWFDSRTLPAGEMGDNLSLMKKHFLLMSLTLICLLSCSTPPKNRDQFGPTYEKASRNLSLWYTFGFEVNQDKYYFASVNLRENGYNCSMVLGYKNDRLAYSFPFVKLYSLRKLYESDLQIDKKMLSILAKIDEINKQPDKECDSRNGEPPASLVKQYSDQALKFLVSVTHFSQNVLFGRDVYIDAFNDLRFSERLRSVRLGMTEEQVNSILKKKINSIPSEKYMINMVLETDRKLVFVFENQRLVAFIWGE